MALTVTNTNTLTLLNILNRNTVAQQSTLKQISTGKRINSGKDDPAGLLALSGLESELRSVNTALTSNARTDSMLSVVDSSLGEISTLLGEIETLVAASSSSENLTDSEIATNQSQIDDALAAIDRIVSQSSFNGKRLLDGSFSIQHTGFAGNAYLDNLRVFSRSQSTSDTSLSVERVASAETASATFAFMRSTGSNTSGTTQVAITGALGTVNLTIASGLTQSQVITAINAAKDQTGVSAIQQATSIKLNSTSFGSDAYVSVEVLSGGSINNTQASGGDGSTANDILSSSKQSGVDAEITVNGQTAATDGLDVLYTANGLSLSFTLAEDFGTGNTAAETTSFTVKADGGATFQLGTTAGTRQTIGIDSVGTFNLGGDNGTMRLSELKSGGDAALDTDVEEGLKAVRSALSQVASLRGRIGGFQKYQVGSAINSLQATQTGLSEATSLIGDTDYAVATANLNRQQVLIQSGLQLLGVVNGQTAQILSLL